MRLLKKSRTRRALGFYRSAYGIKPTYRVVVDGTALHAAYSRQLSLQERLPVLLNGKAELAVTRAVIAELRTLGKEYKAATAAAKRLPKLDGGSSQPGAASASILEMVAGGNPSKLCVCTADPQMQRAVARLAGVPLIRFSREGLVLEPPSRESEQVADVLALEHAQPARPAAVSTPSAAANAPPVRATNPLSGIRKRSKNPNPLSCKKGKKRTTEVGAAGGEGADSRKRKRKSRRSSQGAPSADPS